MALGWASRSRAQGTSVPAAGSSSNSQLPSSRRLRKVRMRSSPSEGTLAAATKLPIHPDPIPSSPPTKGSPQEPRAENVWRSVIWVKVRPARKPKGISQTAMLRWRR